MQNAVARAVLPTIVGRRRSAIGLAVLGSACVQLECGGAFPYALHIMLKEADRLVSSSAPASGGARDLSVAPPTRALGGMERSMTSASVPGSIVSRLLGGDDQAQELTDLGSMSHVHRGSPMSTGTVR